MRTALLLAGVVCCVAVPPDVNFQPFLDFTLKFFKELCKLEDGNVILSVRSLVEQLIILQEITSQDLPGLPCDNQDVYLSIFNQVADSMAAASGSAAAVFPGGGAAGLPEDMAATLVERLGADVVRPLGDDATSWLRRHADPRRNTVWPGVVAQAASGGAAVATASWFESRWEMALALGPETLLRFHGAGPEVDHVAATRADGNFQLLLTDSFAGDFLRVPFQGEQLWLTVALPKENCSVGELLDAVQQWPTDQDLQLFSPRPASILLPSFNLTSALDLAPALRSAGVNGLDISEDGMANTTADPQLTVSQVFQWTSLKVVEDASSEGEAASSTATSAVEGSRLQFHVDRPFLFLVSAHGFKLPLFLGKVESP